MWPVTTLIELLLLVTAPSSARRDDLFFPKACPAYEWPTSLCWPLLTAACCCCWCRYVPQSYSHCTTFTLTPGSYVCLHTSQGQHAPPLAGLYSEILMIYKQKLGAKIILVVDSRRCFCLQPTPINTTPGHITETARFQARASLNGTILRWY